MAKKKSGANKSDFVRSQPASMPAGEVVTKAKEAGLVITAGLVYSVRSAQKGKGSKGSKAKKAAPSAPAAAAAAPAKAASGQMSASDFIRSLPGNTKAASVVKKGAAQGYSFKTGLVYKVRRAMKKSGSKGPKAAPAAVASKGAAAVTPASHRAEFRRLIMLVGLDQAEALCAEMRSELKQISTH